MIKSIRLFLISCTIQLLTNTPAMGKSMQIDEPFYKVFINTRGQKYRVVVNGFDVKNDMKLSPLKVEIPINQFMKTGENVFELQLFPFSKNGNLTKTDEDYVEIEFRLYTNLKNYVVLSRLNYSAKNAKKDKPYDGSMSEGQYALINHKFETNNDGEYIVSKLNVDVKEDAYNKTFMRQSVSLTTPFPEWRFLTSDTIPDPQQFKTKEEMIDGLVGAPFNEIKKIHTALSNKDIDSIMPLFEERNNEMDAAYYYKPGTYEKLLRDAFEEDYNKERILDDLDINIAMPTVSPGETLIQLGLDPLIIFYNESKSVFIKYDIYFRKEGDKWIITR